MSVAQQIRRIVAVIHASGKQPARIYLDDSSIGELERYAAPLFVSRKAVRGTARKFMGIVITTGAIANPPRVIDNNGRAYPLDQESRPS